MKEINKLALILALPMSAEILFLMISWDSINSIRILMIVTLILQLMSTAFTFAYVRSVPMEE